MYDSVVRYVVHVVTGPNSSQIFKSTSTPKYHAADKHDIPPSHFIRIDVSNPLPRHFTPNSWHM